MNKRLLDVVDHEYVAVYGSLKKGFGNHRLIKDSMFIDVGFTEPKFTMYSLGGFPALHKGSDSILVEVYLVNANTTLPYLDSLEGHPDWYKRTLEKITLTNRVQVEAWLYTFCHDPSFNKDNRSIVKPSIVTWNKGNPYDFD